MPSFNGASIFGMVKTIHTTAREHRHQITTFPGVAGEHVLRMGATGGTSTVVGLLTADTTAHLAAAEQTMRTYIADGGAYTFVDNYGVSWLQVILKSYEPEDRVVSVVGIGYGRVYRAMLRHLI